MILIGQNNNAIKNQWENANFSGFMLYVSLDTLSGMDDTADFGNGETCLKDMLALYQPKIVDIGLAIGDYQRAAAGDFDANAIALYDFLIAYPSIDFVVRIGYEHTGKVDSVTFNAVFERLNNLIRKNNVKTCVHIVGNIEASDPYMFPQTPEGKPTFDFIGSSFFTSQDTMGLCRYASRAFGIPLVISESCVQDSAMSWGEYCDRVQRYFAYDNVYYLGYIACRWDEYPMWDKDPFWRGVDSVPTPEKLDSLARVCVRPHISRIVVGAGGFAPAGWTPLEECDLNIEEESSWKRRFSQGSLDNILAEHVWEHLDHPEEAARLAFEYLAPGGTLRVAVPDGYCPDEAYIKYVRPGGSGPGAGDHRMLYNADTLRALLRSAGFTISIRSGYTKGGQKRKNTVTETDGTVRRLSSTMPEFERHSLVVDARKPKRAQ